MTPEVSVEGLSKHFGGVAAVDNVSFDVRQGEVLGLIGPNGAGKTTTINMLSGFMKPSKGTVHFRGENITGLPTHVMAAKGLVRTFQIVTSFPHLNVFDHLFLACLQGQKVSPASIYLHTPSGRRKEKEAKKQVGELLETLHLVPYEKSVPQHLPHGFQRWLFLGMALALNPTLLLLDEPLSGMNATEMDDTLALLRQLKEQRGLSILLVEHNMRAVMNFCDRIVVLQYGEKICEGTPDAIRRDPAVIDAYLGGENDSNS